MTAHVHIDEAEVAAAIAHIERVQRESEGETGIVGIQARLQLAALRPIYQAMAAEINNGATAEQIGKAVAELMSNLVLSVADSITNRDPARRPLEINRMLIALSFCIEASRTATRARCAACARNAAAAPR